MIRINLLKPKFAFSHKSFFIQSQEVLGLPCTQSQLYNAYVKMKMGDIKVNVLGDPRCKVYEVKADE